MDETRILASVRVTNDDRVPEMTEGNELLFAQGLPPYTELSRRGNGFSAIATTAVAGLVVRPSTTAAFTLYNGEPAGSKKCYIIDRLFSHCLVSGNEQGRFAIWACLHPPGFPVPTRDIAPSATNVTGFYGRTYNGLGIIALDEGVTDNGWFPWGYSTDYEPTGVLPGAVVAPEIGGRLIVPPTGAISLHVVASINDSTYCSGLSWYEEELTLGPS